MVSLQCIKTKEYCLECNRKCIDISMYIRYYVYTLIGDTDMLNNLSKGDILVVSKGYMPNENTSLVKGEKYCVSKSNKKQVTLINITKNNIGSYGLNVPNSKLNHFENTNQKLTTLKKNDHLTIKEDCTIIIGNEVLNFKKGERGYVRQVTSVKVKIVFVDNKDCAYNDVLTISIKELYEKCDIKQGKSINNFSVSDIDIKVSVSGANFLFSYYDKKGVLIGQSLASKYNSKIKNALSKMSIDCISHALMSGYNIKSKDLKSVILNNFIDYYRLGSVQLLSFNEYLLLRHKSIF